MKAVKTDMSHVPKSLALIQLTKRRQGSKTTYNAGFENPMINFS